MPEIVRDVTDQIGENIDQLLDVKLMVIRDDRGGPGAVEPDLPRDRPQGAEDDHQLRLLLRLRRSGIPVAILTELVFHVWWLLPICGVLVGYITNWLAIWMIFEPIEPKRILGIKWHALFLRRQDEVAEVYAKIIADEVVTMKHIADELMNGPRGDRTRQMIEDAMRPAVDRAAGSARPLARLAMGGEKYVAVRESVATELVANAMTPLADDDFNRAQSEKIRVLFRDRMREMSHKDFSEMLRTVIQQDEWLLYLHGAVLGLAGGFAHLAVFG